LKLTEVLKYCSAFNVIFDTFFIVKLSVVPTALLRRM